MKRLLILFFLLLPSWFFAQNSKVSVSDFDNAYKNEIKSENDQLTERIKTFPGEIQVMNKQISQAIQNGDDKKALAIAIEMDVKFPKNADIKNFIGKRQVKALDYSNAIKSFNEAISINPKNKWFYVNKAAAQAENKQFEEGLKTIEELIAQFPNWSIAYNLKASFLRELNQQSESLRAYELALIGEPKSAQIYTNRGDLYMELSKEEEAIADYKKALEIQPNYQRAEEKLEAISQKR